MARAQAGGADLLVLPEGILARDIADPDIVKRSAQPLDGPFVTQLLDHDELDDAVASWCQRILRCAPLATRASKQTVMRGLDEASLEQAMANQPRYPAFKRWYECSDRIEGAAAFAEKRAPQWKGE